MVDSATISPAKAWLLATRPRTLTAAVVPVLLGLALVLGERGQTGAGDGAAGTGALDWLVAVLTLSCALAIQVATNLANDYYDFVRGADNEDRLGPTRAVQAGLLTPDAVKRGFILCLGAAALLGVYLCWLGGWPILAIGLVSMLLAWGYTAGPFPLAYVGLGDPFVLAFFGVVPVCGTYYLQTGTLGMEVVMASLPVGFLATALLVVNNLRDRATDEVAGKRTMAVRLGETVTRAEYIGLVAGAFVALGMIVPTQGLAACLPLLAVPLAVAEVRGVLSRSGAALNESLAGTARLHAVFGALLTVGVAW